MATSPGRDILRLISFALATLLGIGLSLVVALAQEGGEHGIYAWLPWVFVVLISLGSLLYLVGNALWIGRPAQMLRIVGFSLMALALLIPTWSTSLALPLLIPVAFTLRYVSTVRS